MPVISVGLRFTASGDLWANTSTVRLPPINPVSCFQASPATARWTSACRWLTWYSERYTAVQRSQHLTQGDPNVFGQSYVANCSSVAGIEAFLGEVAEHRHVDYFQGLEQFREHGLPYELPTAKRDELENDPELREMRAEVAALTQKYDPHSLITERSSLTEARNRLSTYRKTLKRETLQQYQKQWVQNQRVRKILTREKERVEDVRRNGLLQHLCLLRLERGRLTKVMASDASLTSAQT